MSPRLAARVAIVCGLLSAVASYAQAPGVTPAVVRRQVAVIVLDLDGHDTAKNLAEGINGALVTHLDLAPLVTDNAALSDPVDSEDSASLGEAALRQQRALDELPPHARSFQLALDDAHSGQQVLLKVTPKVAIPHYADLVIAEAQALLGQGNVAEAHEAFALVHRLDPKRVLDDVHYLPEVTQAFEAARTQPAGTGTLAIHAMGRVWIDGTEIGPAPGNFTIPVGRHVVWLTGPQRETLGRDVAVVKDKTIDVTIMDGTLSRRQKVMRFRVALAQAPDPAARASAMRELAAFVGVKDAVLLSTVNGKLIYQTWVDHEPGFSALREVGKERPVELLAGLAPPRLPREVQPLVRLPIDNTRWYEKRRYQLGIGAAIVATVVTVVLVVRQTQAAQAWNGPIMVDTPMLGRPR